MRQALVFFLLLFFVASCGAPPPTTQQASRLMMGTLITITVWIDPARPTPGHGAIQQAFAEMARIEALMSSHRPDSPLSRLNQGERGRWLPLDDEIATVLQVALDMQKRADGAFDPGLYTLSRLWGFSQEPPPTQPPPPQAIQQWRQERQPGGVIQIRQQEGERQIFMPNQGVSLDLGGIAKGYAVDRALAILSAAGFPNAIVDGGGNLGIGGSKGDKPWLIGIQHPRQPSGVPVASVAIKNNTALVTSGDYERFFMVGDKRYHHILDPNLGIPAETGLISVSIRHPSAMVADALSTAVFVLGEEKGLALVRSEPGTEALLIRADGQHVATPGFNAQWLGP